VDEVEVVHDEAGRRLDVRDFSGALEA